MTRLHLTNLYAYAGGDLLLFSSSIDLLVVLDRVDSWLDESKRMDDVPWRHSLDNSRVVSAVIVSQTEFDEATSRY